MTCEIGGIYRHHKRGGLYRVLAIAKDHETLEPLVVYRALSGKADVYVRPLAMFMEHIDGVPRFALVQSLPLIDFERYQAESRETAIYPELGRNPVFPALGLAGEVGEVAEKVKKVWCGQDGVYTADDRSVIGKELGDVLWYIAQLATELHLSLQDIAAANMKKIRERKRTNTIVGDGDERELAGGD